MTRHRRDTDALNQDGGAGDRRQRHDTQADQPVRNMLDALRNIGGAGAGDRQGWLDDIVPVAEEEIEIDDNRSVDCFHLYFLKKLVNPFPSYRYNFTPSPRSLGMFPQFAELGKMNDFNGKKIILLQVPIF